MRRTKWLILGTLSAVLSCTNDARTPTTPVTPSSDLAPIYSIGGPPIPDAYIVVLRDGTLPDVAAAAVNAAPRFLYNAALRGFAADLTPGQLTALQQNPDVDYIEPDQVVSADVTQLMDATTGQPWGIDRIDQRPLPLSRTYTYTNDGTGVDVYVIDTGIRFTHSEFGGRARFAYDAFGGNGSDCDGHGTHVAGTIGGQTYGVAKKAALFAVRVLDCTGSGTVSGAIAGVDWVTKFRNGPSVANMSLRAGASSALDQAVNNSISAGVVYAVAAANYSTDACTDSPARIPAAITVAASNNTDTRASFSNYGTCVDLFAPGVGIKSAWATGDLASASLSGTSMASPHAAGVAALYLQTNPNASPATVQNALNNQATTGVISNAGPGTPNRLLYMGFLNPVLQIALASGDKQSGLAGTTLAQPLVVRVTDGLGNAVSGAAVTFAAVFGGGAVTPTATTTNSQGTASTQLKLGNAVGPDSVRATLSSGASVTFSATAHALLTIGSGNNQVGTVGTVLAQPLVARVVDGAGNPVAGVSVSFSAVYGGGSVNPASATSDAQGNASTQLTLGSTVGPDSVRATTAAGATVTFVASAQSASTPPTLQIAIVSGDNQSGPVGTKLPNLLLVKVTDGSGNPVAGELVTFTVMSGGGSVGAPEKTGPLGRADTYLVLGSTPGTNTVKASIRTGAFVTFTATGTSTAPVLQISIKSGNNQIANAGSTLTAPLVAAVTDGSGNPMSGVTVTFAVLSNKATVNPTSAVSNSLGEATAQMTLGPTPGVDSVTAALSSGASVVFVATALAVPQVVMVSGDNQSGIVGTLLPQPLVVRVTDAFGVPLAGHQVSFNSFAGGGTVNPLSAISDSTGAASTQLTLGLTVGADSVRASLANGSSLAFGATAQPVPGPTIAIFSGNNQAGPAGTTLPQQLVVRVTDSLGNPVASEPVTFTVLSGGGTTITLDKTGSLGKANTPLTLGPVPGVNVVKASLGNGAYVIFNATGQ